MKFFTSLSSVKEMELPLIGELNGKNPLVSRKFSDSVDLETISASMDYLPCLIFPKRDMRIRKYNRLVTDTGEITDGQIIDSCLKHFEIRDIDPLKGKNNERRSSLRKRGITRCTCRKKGSGSDL